MRHWTLPCLLVLGLGASPVDADSLEELVALHGRARLLEGHRVELIDDNPEAFERRLQLIDMAEHHILLSTFLWRRDETGTRMLEALEAKLAVARDLEVKVILDATTVGLSHDWWHTVQRRLRSAGAEVRFYNKQRWALTPLWAARLHDKVLIVDGIEAVFGGRNLSDDYFLTTERTWYDADVNLTGPGVAELQMHFLKAWVALGYLDHPRRLVHPPEWAFREAGSLWRTGAFRDGTSPLADFATREWFPTPPPSGPYRAAVLYDNPLVWRRAPTTDLLEALIREARSEIDILTPFPNLPDSTLEAIAAASARGVHVRFVVNDEPGMMRVAKYWRALLPALIQMLEAGVEIWGWQGATAQVGVEAHDACQAAVIRPLSLHAKLVQIDRRIAMVHASNFNVRSAYFNTEAGLLVDDPEFAELIRGRIDRLASRATDSLSCSDGSRLDLGPRARRFTGRDVEEFQQELAADLLRLYRLGTAF